MNSQTLAAWSRHGDPSFAHDVAEKLGDAVAKEGRDLGITPDGPNGLRAFVDRHFDGTGMQAPEQSDASPKSIRKNRVAGAISQEAGERINLRGLISRVAEDNHLDKSAISYNGVSEALSVDTHTAENISTIMHELISNAFIHATRPDICVSLYGKLLYISVADQGQGIDYKSLAANLMSMASRGKVMECAFSGMPRVELEKGNVIEGLLPDDVLSGRIMSPEEVGHFIATREYDLPFVIGLTKNTDRLGRGGVGLYFAKHYAKRLGGDVEYSTGQYGTIVTAMVPIGPESAGKVSRADAAAITKSAQIDPKNRVYLGTDIAGRLPKHLYLKHDPAMGCLVSVPHRRILRFLNESRVLRISDKRHHILAAIGSMMAESDVDNGLRIVLPENVMKRAGFEIGNTVKLELTEQNILTIRKQDPAEVILFMNGKQVPSAIMSGAIRSIDEKHYCFTVKLDGRSIRWGDSDRHGKIADAHEYIVDPAPGEDVFHGWIIDGTMGLVPKRTSVTDANKRTLANRYVEIARFMVSGGVRGSLRLDSTTVNLLEEKFGICSRPSTLDELAMLSVEPPGRIAGAMAEDEGQHPVSIPGVDIPTDVSPSDASPKVDAEKVVREGVTFINVMTKLLDPKEEQQVKRFEEGLTDRFADRDYGWICLTLAAYVNNVTVGVILAMEAFGATGEKMQEKDREDLSELMKEHLGTLAAYCAAINRLGKTEELCHTEAFTDLVALIKKFFSIINEIPIARQALKDYAAQTILANRLELTESAAQSAASEIAIGDGSESDLKDVPDAGTDVPAPIGVNIRPGGLLPEPSRRNHTSNLLHRMEEGLRKAGIEVRWPKEAPGAVSVSVPPENVESAKAVILDVVAKDKTIKPAAEPFTVSAKWTHKPAGWQDATTIYDTPQKTVTFHFYDAQAGSANRIAGAMAEDEGQHPVSTPGVDMSDASPDAQGAVAQVRRIAIVAPRSLGYGKLLKEGFAELNLKDVTVDLFVPEENEDIAVFAGKVKSGNYDMVIANLHGEHSEKPVAFEDYGCRTIILVHRAGEALERNKSGQYNGWENTFNNAAVTVLLGPAREGDYRRYCQKVTSIPHGFSRIPGSFMEDKHLEAGVVIGSRTMWSEMRQMKDVVGLVKEVRRYGAGKMAFGYIAGQFKPYKLPDTGAMFSEVDALRDNPDCIIIDAKEIDDAYGKEGGFNDLISLKRWLYAKSENGSRVIIVNGDNANSDVKTIEASLVDFGAEMYHEIMDGYRPKDEYAGALHREPGSRVIVGFDSGSMRDLKNEGLAVIEATCRYDGSADFGSAAKEIVSYIEEPGKYNAARKRTWEMAKTSTLRDSARKYLGLVAGDVSKSDSQTTGVSPSDTSLDTPTKKKSRIAGAMAENEMTSRASQSSRVVKSWDDVLKAAEDAPKVKFSEIMRNGGSLFRGVGKSGFNMAINRGSVGPADPSGRYRDSDTECWWGTSDIAILTPVGLDHAMGIKFIPGAVCVVFEISSETADDFGMSADFGLGKTARNIPMNRILRAWAVRVDSKADFNNGYVRFVRIKLPGMLSVADDHIQGAIAVSKPADWLGVPVDAVRTILYPAAGLDTYTIRDLLLKFSQATRVIVVDVCQDSKRDAIAGALREVMAEMAVSGRKVKIDFYAKDYFGKDVADKLAASSDLTVVKWPGFNNKLTSDPRINKDFYARVLSDTREGGYVYITNATTPSDKDITEVLSIVHNDISVLGQTVYDPVISPQELWKGVFIPDYETLICQKKNTGVSPSGVSPDATKKKSRIAGAMAEDGVYQNRTSAETTSDASPKVQTKKEETGRILLSKIAQELLSQMTENKGNASLPFMDIKDGHVVDYSISFDQTLERLGLDSSFSEEVAKAFEDLASFLVAFIKYDNLDASILLRHMMATGQKLPGTDFVLGADNSEDDIRSLRRWPEYVATVKMMQPCNGPAMDRLGRSSDSGFLGKDQDLVEVLIRDRRIIKAMGVSLNQLAGWLSEAIKKSMATSTDSIFLINGQRIRVRWDGTMGDQLAPLPGVMSSCGFWLFTNVDTNESFGLASEMHPDLIRLYGFFEGDTSYRTDPMTMYAVFTGKKVADIIPDIEQKTGMKLTVVLDTEYEWNWSFKGDPISRVTVTYKSADLTSRIFSTMAEDKAYQNRTSAETQAGSANRIAGAMAEDRVYQNRTSAAAYISARDAVAAAFTPGAHIVDFGGGEVPEHPPEWGVGVVKQGFRYTLVDFGNSKETESWMRQQLDEQSNSRLTVMGMDFLNPLPIEQADIVTLNSPYVTEQFLESVRSGKVAVAMFKALKNGGWAFVDTETSVTVHDPVSGMMHSDNKGERAGAAFEEALIAAFGKENVFWTYDAPEAYRKYGYIQAEDYLYRRFFYCRKVSETNKTRNGPKSATPPARRPVRRSLEVTKEVVGEGPRAGSAKDGGEAAKGPHPMDNWRQDKHSDGMSPEDIYGEPESAAEGADGGASPSDASPEASSELLERAMAVNDLIDSKNNQIFRYACFSHGIINGFLFDGGRTVTTQDERQHCWAEIGDEETGWLVDTSFDSAPAELRKAAISSDRYMKHIHGDVVVMPLKYARQLYGSGRELSLLHPIWASLRSFLLKGEWSWDYEARLSKDKVLATKARDNCRKMILDIIAKETQSIAPQSVAPQAEEEQNKPRGAAATEAQPDESNQVKNIRLEDGQRGKDKGDRLHLESVPGTRVARQVSDFGNIIRSAAHFQKDRQKREQAKDANAGPRNILVAVEIPEGKRNGMQSFVCKAEQYIDSLNRKGITDSELAVRVELVYGDAKTLAGKIEETNKTLKAPASNIVIIGTEGTIIKSGKLSRFKGESVMAYFDPANAGDYLNMIKATVCVTFGLMSASQCEAEYSVKPESKGNGQFLLVPTSPIKTEEQDNLWRLQTRELKYQA